MINTEDYADDFIAAQKAAAIANGRTAFIINYTDTNGDEQSLNTEEDYSIEVVLDEDGNTEEQFYDGTKTMLERQLDSLVRHLPRQLTSVTTTPVTPTAESQILLVDATSGDRVINLPADADGKTITVKRVDGTTNLVTVSGTIDGGSAYYIYDGYGVQSFVSNGSQWYTIESARIVQRGSQAFAASSSQAVTFSDAMPSTSYRVIVEPNGDPGGGWWITAKGTGGFTINFSGAVTLTANWEASI